MVVAMYIAIMDNRNGYGCCIFRRWLRALLTVICYFSVDFTTKALPFRSTYRSIALLSPRTSGAATQIHRFPLSLQSPKRVDFADETDTTLSSHTGPSFGFQHHRLVPFAPSTTTIPSRRRLFQETVAFLAALATLQEAVPSLPARAGGLLQFPIGPKTQPLKNKYHFMRAAPSLLEVEGIYSTNPLFLTNRENAMDESTGQELVLNALEKIRTGTPDDLFPTVAYHSLAANAMDTADLVARRLQLGREKLLPEFTYLDQRGIGLWDAGEESLIKPAIWALDKDEAGREGKGGRPPANEDGTPNETLDDQFTRLRQFLSLQESRTAGEVILVIFPDGTGPALLSCMIAGIPFEEVHALEFAPGEVRLDITPESVLELYAQRKDDPRYLATLEDGREKLAQLRRTPRNQYVGLKEQRAEQERLEIDEAYFQKKQADAKMEQARQKRVAVEKDRRLQDQERARRATKEQQFQSSSPLSDMGILARSSNTAAGVDAINAGAGATNNSSTSTTPNMDVSILLGGTASLLGIAGIAVAALGKGKQDGVIGDVSSRKDIVDGKDKGEATTTITNKIQLTPKPPPLMTTIARVESSSTSNPKIQVPQLSTLFDDDIPAVVGGIKESVTSIDLNDVTSTKTKTLTQDTTTVTPMQETNLLRDSDRMIEEHLNQLAAAEQAMKEALQEAAMAASTPARINVAEDGAMAMEEDWANDWLQALIEIRDEIDDDHDDYEFRGGDSRRMVSDEIMMVNNGGRQGRDSSWNYDPSSDSNTTLT